MAESPAPQAQTDLFTGGDTLFRSLPQEIDTSAELIARRGAPLFTRTIIPLRSITIENDVSVRVNLGRQNISAGSILFAAGDADRGIYCAPARSVGWVGGGGGYIACLTDSDGDGRFDRQAWGGAAEALPHQQIHAPLDRGSIKAFGLAGNGTELPAPVSYRSAAFENGPKANVDIVWQARRIRNTSTHEVQIWTNGGQRGKDESTPKQTVTIDNITEQSVTIDGVRIIITKISDDGAISYKIDSIDENQPIIYRRIYDPTELTIYL